jgi:prevent-host-death family protein
MAPEWDYDRRVNEGDFGDADFVTTKELRANLAEIVNRVAFGGEQIVVKRHGKPLIAIVATYDLQACQALEDYNDAKEFERMKASGELDEPGTPLDDIVKKYGPHE